MHTKYANSALSSSPPASTFALQVLRDKQKKLELAQRMHELWEESGHTQEAIAEAIGLKHRSYQKALQTGGISYEKLANLAGFHGVELDWLLKGDPEETETPDPFPADPHAEQLDRIERMVKEILREIREEDAESSDADADDVPSKLPPGPTRRQDAQDEDEPG